MQCTKYKKVGEFDINLFKSFVVVVISILVLFPFFQAFSLFISDSSALNSNGSWKIIPFFIFLTIIHESLHILAAIWIGNARLQDVKIGAKWIGPYIHISSLMSVKAYGIVLLAPLIVIAPIAIIAMTFWPLYWLVFSTVLIIGGSAVDIWMFIKLSAYDKNLLVKDHPSRPAFEVYAPICELPEIKSESYSNHSETKNETV